MQNKNQVATGIVDSRARLAQGLSWCARGAGAWCLAIVLAGCAGQTVLTPWAVLTPEQLDNVQTKALGDIQVSVAILNNDEAEQHYGVDIGAAGLQALWVRVRNASEQRLWFIQNTVDRDIYSPDEAALLLRPDIASEDYPLLRQMLRDQAMRVMLPAKTVTEGFIMMPRVEGGRYIDIRLVHDSPNANEIMGEDSTHGAEAVAREPVRLGFALRLPDGIFDYERLNTHITYAGRKLPALEGEQFRQALEALPCCATNADGSENGDPINVVIVADSGELLNSLSRSGWSFTHRITFKSIQRMFGAAIQEQAYPFAPVSDLFLFDRKQDFAMQRARQSITQRNHMRFWLAPFTYGGTQVWVGQVSRDVGVKLTTKVPVLTTHVIDPEVDLAREYLFHSLLAEGFVDKFGFVAGSTIATPDNPAANLTDDPYFSDGMRLVVVLALFPQPLVKVRNLGWEHTMPPVAEGQSPAGERFQRPITEPGSME